MGCWARQRMHADRLSAKDRKKFVMLSMPATATKTPNPRACVNARDGRATCGRLAMQVPQTTTNAAKAGARWLQSNSCTKCAPTAAIATTSPGSRCGRPDRDCGMLVWRVAKAGAGVVAGGTGAVMVVLSKHCVDSVALISKSATEAVNTQGSGPVAMLECGLGPGIGDGAVSPTSGEGWCVGGAMQDNARLAARKRRARSSGRRARKYLDSGTNVRLLSMM